MALATGNPETAPARAATTQRVGRRQRTITTSHAERVTVTGRRYRCSAYRAELPPLAEALDLESSGYSPWVVEGAVRLGGTGAFIPAARQLAHFTGVTMSPSAVRRVTLAARWATLAQCRWQPDPPAGGGLAGGQSGGDPYTGAQTHRRHLVRPPLPTGFDSSWGHEIRCMFHYSCAITASAIAEVVAALAGSRSSRRS